MARDVAELPSRARGSLGERATAEATPPATPLKGPAAVSNRTLHPAWAASGGPRVLRDFRLQGFRPDASDFLL